VVVATVAAGPVLRGSLTSGRAAEDLPAYMRASKCMRSLERARLMGHKGAAGPVGRRGLDGGVGILQQLPPYIVARPSAYRPCPRDGPMPRRAAGDIDLAMAGRSRYDL